MTLHVLATGTLTADPVRRTSQTGKLFATGNIRVAADDNAIFVSIVAFGDTAETLLRHRQRSTIAVSGRAKMSNWTGKDGNERHSLSVVVDQLASAAAARHTDADRRREGRTAAGGAR